MAKKIICRNEDDVQIEFSYNEDAEFFLVSLEGAYSVSNNVVTSANTMTDGSIPERIFCLLGRCGFFIRLFNQASSKGRCRDWGAKYWHKCMFSG